jgi:hypothetical protein
MVVGLLAVPGGWFDTVSMRFLRCVLAFPAILLAIVIVAVIGAGATGALLAVAIVSIGFRRLTRANVGVSGRLCARIAAVARSGASRGYCPTVATLLVRSRSPSPVVLLEMSHFSAWASTPGALWGSMRASAGDTCVIPGTASSQTAITLLVMGPLWAMAYAASTPASETSMNHGGTAKTMDKARVEAARRRRRRRVRSACGRLSPAGPRLAIGPGTLALHRQFDTDLIADTERLYFIQTGATMQFGRDDDFRLGRTTDQLRGGVGAAAEADVRGALRRS